MIKILVTPEKFDEIFSIDDWLHLSEMTNKDAYEYMLNFVVDDDGKPIEPTEARKLFKKIPKKEWPQYISDFMTSVRDAFVNPTNGSDSGDLQLAEPK